MSRPSLRAATQSSSNYLAKFQGFPPSGRTLPAKLAPYYNAMRTEKPIQAPFSINGARSHGPVTAQGKRNSARDSTRHGLLAATVVLEVEAEERFLALLAEYMDEHQPRTATEISLIETMAVARWQLLRVWGAQKTAHWIGTSLGCKLDPHPCAPSSLCAVRLRAPVLRRFFFVMRPPLTVSSPEPSRAL